jgi:C4-dicarboxylate-specific signal transduction histidine kinase
MNQLDREMRRQCRAVMTYLATACGIGIVLVDTSFRILECTDEFAALFGVSETLSGRLITDYLALDTVSHPLPVEFVVPFSSRTCLNGSLHCHVIPAQAGWLLFSQHLPLADDKVIPRMAVLNSELLAIQRDLAHKNLLLAELNGELADSREKLQQQNLELQRAFGALQQETADRLQALEVARASEQMLIQQNRMAAVGEMFSNLAHHGRQPLNLLGLTVQELKLSYRHGQLDRELLDKNVDKSMQVLNQLSRSIDAIMAISVPDPGKRFFRIDLTVERVVALMKETMYGQGIILEVECSEELTAYGYPNEYSQVLFTVLANAKDALEERVVAEPKVTIRCWSENGKNVVTVTDNAGGIGQEVLGRLFTAYFTTKAPGKGTGINLFLSKTIVEKKMGGRLTVRNIGAGAEFRIEV